MIPTFCVYSDNYEPLFQKFHDTLPLGFDLKVKKIVLEEPFGFRTDSWYNAIQQKLNFVLENISSLPLNTLFCVSDTDIYFFKKSNELYKYVKDTFQKDLRLQVLIMQEDDLNQPNGGFIFLRNTPIVQELLKRMIQGAVQRLPFADQSVLQTEISRIRHRYINRNYVVWGTKIFNAKMALFHHAVCCGTVDEKLAQQELIKSKIP